MIRLRRAPNLLIAQHWVNLLEQARISCELHNQYMQGAMGDIPVDQCGPEVWLEREADLPAAQRLIDGGAPTPGAPLQRWRCGACNEWLEPQFTTCWNCGSSSSDFER
ncbi:MULTISPECIES: DUF2007 domain-containing protein [unclassified Achromobacter]|uniref:putative signal transducing protein n=1 Tax=unclassified Achromobacter TaxID=2626865 RepID=UPI000B517CE3|nr:MULTISPECIES: DUF2007 domain-containing protein [unclassified Achromobacter]OWT69082.1 hypothetical protein CEY05_27975 [Achromobacter sp. HZ34]OWT70487.1 hypothetical protein CEY04_26805 [Achromobacter sp. HZ28]